MSTKKALVLSIFLVFGLALSFGMGYLFRDLQSLDDLDIGLVEEAYTILNNHALPDPPASPGLQYGMIHGLVAAYGDPYTLFIEPARHELQSDDLRGEFGGVGVRLEKDLEGNIVLYPLPDSPAATAKIGDGDHLLAVDKLAISSTTNLDEAQAALRGPVGTRVSLMIRKPEDISSQTVELERVNFPIPSVTWNIDTDEPRLGIVQISRIAATTPAEVQTAINDLVTQGAQLFVLDLRGNPGGLLDAGVNTARLFLQQGVVIQEQYKNQPVHAYEVEEPGVFSDLPLAVIIDHGTASAAELIAGAIKAQNRGRIYGQNSFGKDSLQLIFELHDDSSLHVTAAKWWVPGLEPPLAGNGVLPDVPVTADADQPKPEIRAVIEDMLDAP